MGFPALVDPGVECADKRTPGPRSLLGYFAGLRAPQRVLWCYLIWYLIVAMRYFDPNPSLWLSSLGISAIIGVALFLSTSRAGRTPVRLDRWQLARLFIMPFCVSSYAALIKGHGFVLVLHPTLRANLLAASACALFIGGSFALGRLGTQTVSLATIRMETRKSPGPERAGTG